MLLPQLVDVIIDYLTGADLSLIYGPAAIPILSKRLEHIKPGLPSYKTSIPIETFCNLPDYGQVLYVLYQPDFYIQTRYIRALSTPDCTHNVLTMLIQLCHDVNKNKCLVLTIIQHSVRQGYMDILWMLRDHPSWGCLIDPSMLLRSNERYGVSIDDFIEFSRNATMSELRSCLVDSMPLYKNAGKYLPYFVERGVNLNQCYQGRNVLIRAVVSDNIPLIAALVNNKANVNIVVNCETPLMYAVDSCLDTFTTLLQLKADPNFRVDELTALDKARSRNNQDVINALLKRSHLKPGCCVIH